jgi:hypothetical protein
MIVAARNPSQNLVLMAARITMNSPTNPLVPGVPALAIAKSIAEAANFGMVLTTPPVVRDQAAVHAVVEHAHARNRAAETKP